MRSHNGSNDTTLVPPLLSFYNTNKKNRIFNLNLKYCPVSISLESTIGLGGLNLPRTDSRISTVAWVDPHRHFKQIRLQLKRVPCGGGGPSPSSAIRDMYSQSIFSPLPIPCNMDQITIKTPNHKCRLQWCLIEFIDWRYSQSCWYFCCVESIYKSYTLGTVYMTRFLTYKFALPPQTKTYERKAPQTDKHMPPSQFTDKFLRKVDIQGL